MVYAPNSQNVPLLKEKGEVNISGSYLGTWSTDGFGIKGAAALDSGFALAVNYNRLTTDDTDSDDWLAKFSYFEGAIGTFGEIKGTDFIYEVFGGVGQASIDNTQRNEAVNIRYLKPFIQPSIGLHKEAVELALTTRLALVSYRSHEISLSDPGESTNLKYFFEEKGNTLVLEPGFTTRIGLKGVKLEFQYAITTFSQPDLIDGWIEDSVMSLGLNFYPR